MSLDVHALEPAIRDILSAPGTDLATISAKRVRKELVDRDPALTPELVKEKKEEIDAVIARVYEEVSAARNGNGTAADHDGDDDDDELEHDDARSSTTASKRKRANDDDDASSPADDDLHAPPGKAKKTKQRKTQLTDEELARQLSSEINARGRTSRAAASSKSKQNGTKRAAKRGPKSSATVASDAESGDEVAKPKKRGGGFKKEYLLSEPLAAVLKVDRLSRPQTVKQLWDHIKANNMQNPENKKEIICDDGFRAIFKCDRIDMFEMNRQLSQHLHEAPAPAPAPSS